MDEHEMEALLTELERLTAREEQLEQANRLLKKHCWIIWDKLQKAKTRRDTAEAELKQFRRYWWCFKRDLGIHMDAVPFEPDDNTEITLEQALAIIDELRRFAAPHVKRLNSRRIRS